MKKDTNPQPLRHLILLLGSGGVGKTWFAKLLVAFLLKKNIKLKVYDADEPTKQDLTRFFPAESESRDLGNRDEIIPFFNEMLKGDADVTVVDMKADRQSDLRNAKFFSPKIVELWQSRERLKLTVVIPIIGSKSSSQVVTLDWYDVFGPAANYVLVHNEVSGKIDTKHNSKELQQFIAQANPAAITLQALSADLAKEMDYHGLRHSDVIKFGDLDFESISREYSFTLGGSHSIAEVADDWEYFETQAEIVFGKLLMP